MLSAGCRGNLSPGLLLYCLNNAFLLVLQVGPHDLFGGLAVLVEDGVKQLFMFRHQHGMLLDILDIFHAVAVELFPKIVDDGDQSVIAGRLKNSVVKLLVLLHNIDNIIGLGGLDKLPVRLF